MRLPKFLSTLAADARTGIVGALAVTAGLAVLAVFAGWMGIPAALLSGAMLFAIIGLAWNQWQQVLERDQKRRKAKWTPADTEKRIRDWLYAFRYQIRDATLAQTYFSMFITNDMGLQFNIRQMRDTPWVVIESRNGIPSDDKDNRLFAAVNDPRLHFKVDVSIELAQLGVEHLWTESEGRIDLSIERKVVFDETMTDMKFFDDLLLVHRGANIFRGLAALALQQFKAQAVSELPPASKHDRLPQPPSPE